jgi:hypothetical protein
MNMCQNQATATKTAHPANSQPFEAATRGDGPGPSLADGNSDSATTRRA